MKMSVYCSSGRCVSHRQLSHRTASRVRGRICCMLTRPGLRPFSSWPSVWARPTSVRQSMPR